MHKAKVDYDESLARVLVSQYGVRAGRNSSSEIEAKLSIADLASVEDIEVFTSITA